MWTTHPPPAIWRPLDPLQEQILELTLVEGHVGMRLHHRLVDVRVLADDGHELGFAVSLLAAASVLYVGEMLPVVSILAVHPVILVAGGVAHTGPAE